MDRRGFFQGLLVAASAFVVAPAVTVEAAPLTATNDPSIDLRSYDAGYDQAIRELYAEGYERGRAVEQAKAESRAMVERPYREVEAPALTFTRDDFLPARPVTDLQLRAGGAGFLHIPTEPAPGVIAYWDREFGTVRRAAPYRGYPPVIDDTTASKRYVYYDGQWHESHLPYEDGHRPDVVAVDARRRSLHAESGG